MGELVGCKRYPASLGRVGRRLEENLVIQCCMVELTYIEST